MSCTAGLVMVTRFRNRSDRLKSSSVKSILPDSILLMSSTSLISDSKWLLDTPIFLRHSLTRSGSSRCFSAMAVIPRMAFMGVLMSWLIRDKNSLLDALARVAAS